VSADDEVTTGELRRLILGLREDFREIPKAYLALAVWTVEKAAFDSAIKGLGREIGDLRAKYDQLKQAKESEHDAMELALHQEVRARESAVPDLEAALERKKAEVAKERAQRLFAIGLAILSAVLGIIGTVVGASVLAALNGGGGA
jgi:hypothetical protein